MASNDKPQKVSIGFDGGQVLSARVGPGELSKLRNALGTDGWHELTAEDGTVALDLEQHRVRARRPRRAPRRLRQLRPAAKPDVPLGVRDRGTVGDVHDLTAGARAPDRVRLRAALGRHDQVARPGTGGKQRTCS